MQQPESFLTRWLNAVRPIPSQRVYSKAEREQRRRQKRLIIGTVCVVTLGAAGWYLYDYFANAPQRAQAVLREGVLQLGPGREPEAIKTLSRAIEIWPQYAEAYMYRGIAEHSLGRVEEASIDLDKASELKPSLTRPYAERGRIYEEKGDMQRVIGEFTTSLRIGPTAESYYQRALAYEKLGDHQKAIADFDQAIAEMRDAPYAYRARAMAKEALGDAEGAKEDRAVADGIQK
ncbi:MAG TPA: tetratricopeptide repeat protein [Bryobacteraceae bacterium]|nr:tetratricopeptide repeat protein [Bryobacteraceae bacterium]